MTDKIIKALRELDVNNDNHWTDAGLPRIETVRLLAGNGSLSRDEVNAAAPGFNRQNPTLENPATSAPAAAPVPTPPPAPVTPVAAPAAPLPGAEIAAATGENGTATTDAGDSTDGADSQAAVLDMVSIAEERARDLASMQNYMSRLEGEREALSAEIDKVRREIDKAILEESEKPAEDPMIAWRQNLSKEVENRIAFQKEFGPKIKALGELPKLRSPLDSAMAAQNDRKRREGNR